MEKHIFCKTFRYILKACFLGFVLITTNSSYAATKCQSFKKDFKDLYLELQGKLNYEGKDTVRLPSGKYVLQKHKDGTPYPGKVFEEALFKEYQNSLRKVAKLYQLNKKDSESFKSNEKLVEFFKQLDSGDAIEFSSKIDNKYFSDVLADLKKESENKFTNDEKSKLTDNDLYLLRKLYTHAQDRICTVAKYESNPNYKQKNFSTSDLKRYKEAPLNRIITEINRRKIGANSEIKLEDLKDEEIAIWNSVFDQIKKLKDFVAKNKDCLKFIQNPNFIQTNIQTCNYKKFLDTLSNDNTTDIEKILHFINANEQFLSKKAPKFETKLNEELLELRLNQTFSNLNDKIRPSCKKINNKLIVYDLEWNKEKNQFDRSQIQCKQNNKNIDCKNNLEFVLSDSGMGLEVKSKNKKIQVSLKDNPDCENIEIDSNNSNNENNPPQLPPSAPENNTTPPTGPNKPPEPPRLNFDNINVSSKENCEKLKDNRLTIIKDAVWDSTNNCCKLEFNSSTSLVFLGVCKDTGSANENQTPPVLPPAENDEQIDLNEAKNKCEEKNNSFDGNKYTWDENDIQTPCHVESVCEWDEDKKECVKEDKLKTEEDCKKENKILSEDKKECVEPAKDDKKDDKKKSKCDGLDEETGRPLSNIEKQKCLDDEKNKDNTPEDEEDPELPNYAPKNPPPRVMPPNIPQRSPSMLLGMP